MENYNVDYFIEKFKAIKDSLWICNTYGSNGKACALGHCSLLWSEENKNKYGNPYGEEQEALLKLFGETYNSDPDESLPAKINDGRHPDYQQSTPKQRIIAALIDVKNKEEGDKAVEIVNNIIKEEKLELV